MKTSRNTNFREILEHSRGEAAERAWARAGLASALRHSCVTKKKCYQAARLGLMKAQSLRLAATLLPEQVHVTIDDDYQIGLVSIRWKGHGRFHLPGNAPVSAGCTKAVINV